VNDITAWQRTNEQEPTPALPRELLYDPITGDGDFQYLSLEDRLKRLFAHHRQAGFSEGFFNGRRAMIDHAIEHFRGMERYENAED
jgi:hypothetical protein